MNWRGVPSTHIEEVWNQAAPLIDLALEYAIVDASAPTLKDEAERKRAQLWVLEEEEEVVAAVVTQLVMTREGVECVVLVAAGEGLLTEVITLIDGVISEWARTQGCVGMSSLARKGWERAVPKSWKATHVVVRREL